MGGRNSGGGKSASNQSLDSESWSAWSEDPSIYQMLSNPELATATREQMYEDGWEKADVDEMQELAERFRDLSESEVVQGVDTLYRGERFRSLEEAQRIYAVGKTITNNRLTSYSTDEALAKEYARMYSGVAVVIKNTNTKGDFVGLRANHSGYKKGTDPEVLTQRGMKSRVVDTKFDKKTNTLYVTMQNSTTRKGRKR